MSVRRMLPFILVNVVVSAAVVLAILYWWDGRKTRDTETGTTSTAAVIIPTPLTTSEPAVQVTSTPEPEEEGPLTHVVKPGETLGRISQFYDVPLDDIMVANGIDDPNRLDVGQELIIPVGGIATATPSAAAQEDFSELPTPIATDMPLTEGEIKVEITAVTGVQDLTEEAVQITNLGGRQIALLDWKLADADGHVYTFDKVTLFGDGAAITIHTETGQNTAADLYWGLESPIWEPGERVTLLDSEESIQAVFDIP